MNILMSVRMFVGVILRRLVRDRVALFFMVVLPVTVIVIIGVTFGAAGGVDIGVVREAPGSPAADAIAEAIDRIDGVGTIEFASAEDLRAAIRRQSIGAGVVLPADLDTGLETGDVTITFIALPEGNVSMAARDVVIAAAATVLAPADAARFAAELTGADPAVAREVAAGVGASMPTVEIVTTDVGRARRTGLSQFSFTAPQNLVLFVFINSMASGAALVRMRQRGVLRRVLAGPGGAGTIVLGLLAAWVLIALLQSLLIIAVGAIGFGVDWGPPVAAGALVLVFALVGAGAGLLVGALAGNEDRVNSITPPFGIVLGALGGCMVPLEIFPPAMRTIAHAVPHYWAMTAWQRLIFDGDGIGGIAVPLLVLSGFAALSLTSAALMLKRSLVRG